MSLWIVDGGMVELPVVARVEDWEEGSYIEITGSDDGEEWNDAPIRYVAERTCHDSNNRFNAWQCSECGATMLLVFDDFGEPTFSVDGVADVPHYCPNCGAKVVDE